MILAALFLLASADSVQANATLAMVEPDPKAMTQRQIREHNAKVPRGHPFYIRCQKSEEIGSLVKRLYSCRTNRQWREAEDKGNQDVRDTADKMASKAWETSTQ